MIALPFRGEFGWLVAMWVPWLRHLRHKVYPTDEFTVLCLPGQLELFRDFAWKVIELDTTLDVTRVDCANCFVRGHGRWTADDEMKLLQPRFKDKGWKLPTRKNVVSPDQLPFHWPDGKAPRPLRAEHLEWCESIEMDPGCIALHARACLLKQPERNWPIERWNALAARLKVHFSDIIAVGSRDGAVVPDGARDMRGLTIAGLMQDLARSSMLVGPSSGPHALALQCATPVVWWSANRKDVDRYQSAWNPFNMQNERAGVDWQPSVDLVFESILRVAHRGRSQAQVDPDTRSATNESPT